MNVVGVHAAGSGTGVQARLLRYGDLVGNGDVLPLVDTLADGDAVALLLHRRVALDLFDLLGGSGGPERGPIVAGLDPRENMHFAARSLVDLNGTRAGGDMQIHRAVHL